MLQRDVPSQSAVRAAAVLRIKAYDVSAGSASLCSGLHFPIFPFRLSLIVRFCFQVGYEGSRKGK